MKIKILNTVVEIAELNLEKHCNYEIDNYLAYGITNNKYEFIELLHVLALDNESLESFNDACNGYLDFICNVGIYNRNYSNKREVLDDCFYGVDFLTLEQLIDCTISNISDYPKEFYTEREAIESDLFGDRKIAYCPMLKKFISRIYC